MVGLSYSGEQTLADRSPFTLKDGNAKKTRTHETSIRTHRKPKKGGKKAFSNNSTTDLRYIRLSRLYKVLCFFYALRGLVGYYLNLANGLKRNYVNEKVFVVKYAINRQHFQ